MAPSLRSFADWEVDKVVARRLKEKAGGLGTLAAKDYQEKNRGNINLAIAQEDVAENLESVPDWSGLPEE